MKYKAITCELWSWYESKKEIVNLNGEKQSLNQRITKHGAKEDL